MDLYDNLGLSFRKSNEGNFLINPGENDIQKIKDLEIKNLELNDSLGVPPSNLRFLEQIPFIEGISIVMLRDLNLSPIHSLKNLQRLRVTKEFNQEIDLLRFPLLKHCQIVWNKNFKNIDRATLLEILTLTGYKKDDLSELNELRLLKKLSLIQSSVKTINGLQNSTGLEHLELIGLKKLESLKGIEYFPELKRLDIESSYVNNLDSLSKSFSLEVLGIHDGKSINSLKPIANLGNLKTIYLSGNTNIIDGDMTPLIGRKDASFGTRKHYSHSSEQIDVLNGTVRVKQTWDW